ncbi:MAG TPA: G1 family glutamic endopeptidase [Candidatus Dormibacteraeota bacterium]|nr:G1 family glutamic endopeptidase [Candidatus Dormibacteraeota bacterium]
MIRGRAIRGLLALAGVAAALPLGAPPVGASGLIATRPADCAAAFNPYLYTQAAAGACARTYATTGDSALAGGGTARHYTVAGMAVSILMPPAGFRPASATDAQLDALGFPPRPADPSDLRQWQTEMSEWTGPAPTPGFLATSPARADSVTSLNWSGYVVTGGAGTFTHAEAFYTEPSFGSSVCATNSEVTWAGIGGWNSGNLAQDGTSHNVPGLANHQAWWEILPASITAVNLTAHAGFTFDASTRRISGGFRFFLMDSESGQTVAFDVSSSRYDGSSAEAIAERPTVNGSFTNLSNFGTLTVSTSRANDKGFDTFSPNGSRHGVHMVDSSGGDMADPSTISSPGFFTVTQHHCS